MLSTESVLQFVRDNGPSVPNKIRKALGGEDNMLIGAMLSDLVSKHALETTHLSLGTSRFYYDPAKPESLETIRSHLGEKDLRACDLLRTERVVRHSALTPLMRVAMAAIKDFSRPVRYPVDGDEELFWRYYLLPESEALNLIGERYFGQRKVPLPTPVPEQVPASAPTVQAVPVQKPVKRRRPQAKVAAAPAPPTEPAAMPLTDTFAQQVHDYFDGKGIGMLQALAVKKGDLTLLVNLPTAVGPTVYFCKAKAKKTTAEGDLATALLEARKHELPLLYLAGGTLAKRARGIATSMRGSIILEPWA